MNRKKLKLMAAVLAPSICGFFFAYAMGLFALLTFFGSGWEMSARLQGIGASLMLMAVCIYATAQATLSLWERVNP